MKKAFTLMELILVVALISILSCILIPNTNIFHNLKEKQEIREFRKDILLTRNRAIINQSNYYIKLVFDDNKYVIRGLANNDTIKSKTFTSGLKLSRRTNLTDLLFEGSGKAGKSGTIYITNRKNKEYIITISPITGSVAVKYDG